MSESVNFQAVQEHFGFQTPAPVEKDWHVVRAMRAITSIDVSPFRLVFAGGTCLARAHRLISRMSEDADFKVVPLDSKSVSRSQLRRQLGELREKVTAILRTEGFAIEDSQIRSRDDNRYIIYDLPYADPGQAHNVLRPTIKVELNFATLRQPSITLPVSSFAAEAYGHAPEIPAITCVSVAETAAEKFVSLTRRTAMELAGASRAIDPTLVRHIYDLHQIQMHIDRATTIELTRAIATADAEEFKNQYPAYADDIAGETRKAVAYLGSEPEIRERYSRFLALMVYGEQVDFTIAMDLVASLSRDAWA